MSRGVLHPVVSLTAVAVSVALTVAGCGGESKGFKVTSTDDECSLEETTFDAGKITFSVTNDGSDVTEFYVYTQKDGTPVKIVSEVENIGPGTSRDMTVDLEAGTYLAACKPGMVGDGILEEITVK